MSEIRGNASQLRARATLGSFTAAGRVFGYARDVAVAAVLGAGPVAQLALSGGPDAGGGA